MALALSIASYHHDVAVPTLLSFRIAYRGAASLALNG